MTLRIPHPQKLHWATLALLAAVRLLSARLPTAFITFDVCKGQLPTRRSPAAWYLVARTLHLFTTLLFSFQGKSYISRHRQNYLLITRAACTPLDADPNPNPEASSLAPWSVHQTPRATVVSDLSTVD